MSQAGETSDEQFLLRAQANQKRLTDSLRNAYDFIVCGSGSSGSVVARRLAENPQVSVLLVEAGGTDDLPQVQDAARWRENFHSGQDWAFKCRSNPHLNGRSMPWPMGKVLGGSSSINAMAWARGHKNDWDFFASEADDDGWSYRNVLDIYKSVENWQGPDNPEWRGTDGPVVVRPQRQTNLSAAVFESCASRGIPSYIDQNGELMENPGGAALGEYLIIDGKRQSIFRSYAYPYMDRPNLTVLTHALVTRILLSGTTAVGAEVVVNGALHKFGVGNELILSLGAIQTPKVLMQSGIGDESHLREFGVAIVQNIPGVGRNLQDHNLFAACVWQYPPDEPQRIGSPGVANFFCKSDEGLVDPDLVCLVQNDRFPGPETNRLDATPRYWSIVPSLMRPRSHGRVYLTGPNPNNPVDIDAQVLSDPYDVKAAVSGIKLCREIGGHKAFGYTKSHPIMPVNGSDEDLEDFVRNGAISFHHYACTARMGSDEMSVVDGNLRVHGIERLRIADASVLPRITTGNTMAPCVVVGERAAAMLREHWKC
jgi:choline dehydrogenase